MYCTEETTRTKQLREGEKKIASLIASCSMAMHSHCDAIAPPVHSTVDMRVWAVSASLFSFSSVLFASILRSGQFLRKASALLRLRFKLPARFEKDLFTIAKKREKNSKRSFAFVLFSLTASYFRIVTVVSAWAHSCSRHHLSLHFFLVSPLSSAQKAIKWGRK